MSGEWLNIHFALSYFCLSLFFSYSRPPFFQCFDLCASNTGETLNSFCSVRWASLSLFLSQDDTVLLRVISDSWICPKLSIRRVKWRLRNTRLQGSLKAFKTLCLPGCALQGELLTLCLFLKWKIFCCFTEAYPPSDSKNCLYHSVMLLTKQYKQYGPHNVRLYEH